MSKQEKNSLYWQRVCCFVLFVFGVEHVLERPTKMIFSEIPATNCRHSVSMVRQLWLFYNRNSHKITIDTNEHFLPFVDICRFEWIFQSHNAWIRVSNSKKLVFKRNVKILCRPELRAHFNTIEKFRCETPLLYSN